MKEKMKEIRRLNKYINICPDIKAAVRAENKRIDNKKLEECLEKCFKRMYGEVCPIKRNTGYPFEWH